MVKLQGDARKQFVGTVYSPYRVEVVVYDKGIPEDELPEDFYALIPASAYILGEEVFFEVLANFTTYTYDKAGNPLGEAEYGRDIYLAGNKDYLPVIEYYDLDTSGYSYRCIPISWDEFPHHVLDNLDDNSPIVQDSLQLTETQLLDEMKSCCGEKSPKMFMKYIDPSYKYDFLRESVNWVLSVVPDFC